VSVNLAGISGVAGAEPPRAPAEQDGLLSTDDRLNLDDFKLPMWNYSVNLRGGIGYKDNVLLSHADAQGSAFWLSAAELLLFRLPSRGWQINIFADFSDARYFDAGSVTDEQSALAVAQVSKNLGLGWKSTVGLNYMYQNQVFDYSQTYATNASIGQILGHTVTARWALRKALGSYWVEGEMIGTRQWLEAPLDDYWQFGPRLAAGRTWGRGSEVALSYQPSHLAYDRREQADAAGGTITNTSLALNTHSLELMVTQVWDKEQHWRTITSLGYGVTVDNGSGYYNYDEYRLSQQVRYQGSGWELTARARVGHYQYREQAVSATDADLRRKTMLGVNLRVERVITKNLKGHLSYSWDRSISNLDFDDYQANIVLGGVAIVF